MTDASFQKPVKNPSECQLALSRSRFQVRSSCQILLDLADGIRVSPSLLTGVKFQLGVRVEIKLIFSRAVGDRVVHWRVTLSHHQTADKW